MSTWGKRLKKLRQRQCLTLCGLADKTGLPRRQLQHVEDGVATPSPAEIMRIASALGMRTRELW